jgi:hypothetical protein
MTRTTKHILGAAIAAAAALTPVAWRMGRVHDKLYAASNPPPFTIQQHYEVTGPHVGAAAVFELRTIALRSDGARVNLVKEPRKGWVSRDLRFSNGVLQTVYDDVRAVVTVQLSASEQQNRRAMDLDPAANCALSLSGEHGAHPSTVQGQEERFGIPVSRVLNGNNLTLWMAPSLGCTALEHFVDWDSAHPGTNTSRLKLDSVTLAEPDAALFAVPSNYAEMPPSQATALHMRFGAVPEDAVQKFVAQAAKNDSFYLAHRPQPN